MSEFLQDPPRIANTWRSDRWLQLALRQRLPAGMRETLVPGLDRLGERAAGEMLAFADDAETHPPRHVPYDAWGRRIDRIETAPGWRELHRVAAEEGIVAVAYERRQGRFSRLHQLARLVLYHPSSAIYSCPLAMTDGAARTLETLGDDRLRHRVLAHLVAREPGELWTAGQWMTERSGGSDVAGTETVARREGHAFRLWGTKWFTSAVTAEVALGLARIEGAPAGNEGLSLFLVELGPESERTAGVEGVRVLRLKDKLGTRALPTAELELAGVRARLVGGEGQGVRKIATVLNITRLYNSACAIGTMRRAVDLARDYAGRRRAFGRLLRDLPLHVETLAALEVETAGALALVAHLFTLAGAADCNEARVDDETLLRVLTPVAKLYTGRQAVAVASEAIEACGGAGYVEDTGLPRILRDAQVLPIWEGTTNVLSLDVQRALAAPDALPTVLAACERQVEKAPPALAGEVDRIRAACTRLAAHAAAVADGEARQAGARAFAMGLGATVIAALLVKQAGAAAATDDPATALAVAAARRWAERDLAPVGPQDARRRGEARRLGVEDEAETAVAEPAGPATAPRP